MHMGIKDNTLKSNWRVMKFCDCVKQLNTGLNPRSNFSLGSGKLKYITAKNLTEYGTIDFSKCDLINEKAKEIINRRSNIQVGDILFSSRAPIGHCHLIKEEPDYYDIGESIFSIRVKTEILMPEYLCLYLASDFFVKLASKHTTGSIIQEIRVGDLMDTEVIVPPLKVQDRISICLDKIDRKIAINSMINDNLEQQAKLLYDYWFTQFDFPNADGKPYQNSGGKMVWNEILKRNIPFGWQVVPFLEIASWESNSQPPKSEFIYEPKAGYIRFIQNRDYDSDTHKTYIPLTKNLSVVDRYDILMDKYGDAGAVRYGIEGAFNVALGKISVHNPYHREYIRSFLESDGIYNYLHNSCMASTRASLNESNLAMLNIVIPNEHIVSEYEKLLLKIRDSILQNNDETARLIELRDWLLPMLMNGQAIIE